MCLTPFVKDGKQQIGKQMFFPCGKCPQCKARRASAWSFRLMEEDRVSKTSYFITLTYDDDKCSIVRTRNKFLSLSKRHVQLFLKKIRKQHSSNRDHTLGNIKYYCAGEYGTKRMRPHYHLIIFNLQLKLMFSEQDILLMNHFNFDGKTRVMCHQWEHGTVTVGKVSGASVGYTMKYISKEKKVPMHSRDDRIPEFGLMSKGLGKAYLTDEVIQYHRQSLTEKVYLTVESGKKLSMPRYYKEKIYPLKFEREMIGEQLKIRLDKQNFRNYQLLKQGWDSFIHNRRQAIKAGFKKMYTAAASDTKTF